LIFLFLPVPYCSFKPNTCVGEIVVAEGETIFGANLFFRQINVVT